MFKRLLMIGVLCLSVIAVSYPVKPAWGFIKSSGFCRCGSDCFDCKRCPQLYGCTAYNLEGLLNLLAGIPCSEAFAASAKDYAQITPFDLSASAVLAGLGCVDCGGNVTVLEATLYNLVVEFLCVNYGGNSSNTASASAHLPDVTLSEGTEIDSRDLTNGRFDWYGVFFYTNYAAPEGNVNVAINALYDGNPCQKSNWSRPNYDFEIDEFDGDFLVYDTYNDKLSLQTWHCKEVPRSNSLDCQPTYTFEVK
jgi:hypothetical protein